MVIKGILVLLFLLAGAQSLASDSQGVDIALVKPVELVSENLQVFPQWTALLKRMEGDRLRLRLCEQDLDQCDSHRLVAWLGKLHSLENLPADELLQAVNRYVNSYSPKSDLKNYRLKDYWASPLEFLENSGDDEDAAVMKYFMLREQGVSPEDLRITRIKDGLENRDNTVLLVKQSGGGFLLLSARQNLVQSLSQMRYSTPVYSINESHYWLYIRP